MKTYNNPTQFHQVILFRMIIVLAQFRLQMKACFPFFLKSLLVVCSYLFYYFFPSIASAVADADDNAAPSISIIRNILLN
jgi:hypothetical protein